MRCSETTPTPLLHLTAPSELTSNSPLIMISDLAFYNGDCVVPKNEAIRFVRDCLGTVGLSEETANSFAHHLVYSDTIGTFCHGSIRLRQHMEDVKQGNIDLEVEPEIVHDFKAIALVDGGNGFGHVTGKYCMRMAIEKAHRFGIGLVCARGSNDPGTCGYYSRMAMDRGMIGFCCSNESPVMAPPNSYARLLGSNPLSMGMTAFGTDSFFLDMSSTTSSMGKIVEAKKKAEPIPGHWAIDEQGGPIRDPGLAQEKGALLPLGLSSSYKGFGLALMVEILAGILSDSDCGPEIREYGSSERTANLGHAFIAIYPNVFAPGSRNRLAHLLMMLREARPIGSEPVLVPGDREKMHASTVEREGGIHYHVSLMRDFKSLADDQDVSPMRFLKKANVSFQSI